MDAIEALVTAADGDRDGLSADQFVVAGVEDGNLLGCGRLRPYPEFCELASLAVAEDVWAKGVGRAIVTSLLERYKGPIYLICEDGVVDFFSRFKFESMPETEMPAGLRPKWEYFSTHAGSMNVMCRR
jgi:N-acetylglutamate synthase-like GNAT family acetyltransferase